MALKVGRKLQGAGALLHFQDVGTYRLLLDIWERDPERDPRPLRRDHRPGRPVRPGQRHPTGPDPGRLLQARREPHPDGRRAVRPPAHHPLPPGEDRRDHRAERLPDRAQGAPRPGPQGPQPAQLPDRLAAPQRRPRRVRAGLLQMYKRWPIALDVWRYARALAVIGSNHGSSRPHAKGAWMWRTSDTGDTAWMLDQHGAGHADDAGAGLLLRRPGAPQERALHHDAVLHPAWASSASSGCCSATAWPSAPTTGASSAA